MAEDSYARWGYPRKWSSYKNPGLVAYQAEVSSYTDKMVRLIFAERARRTEGFQFITREAIQRAKQKGMEKKMHKVNLSQLVRSSDDENTRSYNKAWYDTVEEEVENESGTQTTTHGDDSARSKDQGHFSIFAVGQQQKVSDEFKSYPSQTKRRDNLFKTVYKTKTAKQGHSVSKQVNPEECSQEPETETSDGSQ